ncbi:MAG: hypothetical protein VX075_11045 [Pseudomonadota bacterium]|nr:hypothetical protein [Pseudomonadota bacterium]MEC8699126.1 hypothetical protein [Pseudomonadota bacterium]
MVQPTDGVFIGLPQPDKFETVLTGQYFEAMDNFVRTFAFRPDDTFVFLADRKLDPRVIHAICGLARSRGIKPTVIVADNSQATEVPEELRPLVETATFVVSSWFCSIIDPFCIRMRNEKGQRWVKITYFRDLDLLKTPQARFPIDIVGEIIRQTADMFPKGQDFDLKFGDKRGTDLTIKYTAEMRENLLGSNRWRGQMAADEPGCYVHYLPCHGPNVYDRTSVNNDDSVEVDTNGVVVPYWAVGFEKPFENPPQVVFEDDRIVEVNGDSEEAVILRDMLVGGQLIELGCGFNPKAPRHTVYPAGSNSVGALHFGIDLAKPNDYIRRMMPEWEEPPVHMDLISFDSTVMAGNTTLIDEGFLKALDAPSVVEMASQFGDPVDLLQNWPD